MSNEATEFLVWKSGAYAFALELPFCREIVNGVELTRLPRAPHFVLGLANLRGSVISVIDLEVLLGYRSAVEFRSEATLIRLRTDGYPVAVVADTIRDTQFIEPSAIEPAPANLAESESNFIRKVAKTGEGLLLIPDLNAIVSRIN